MDLLLIIAIVLGGLLLLGFVLRVAAAILFAGLVIGLALLLLSILF